MEDQKEIWKDIIGFEGQYQISNFGRLKSLPKLLPGGNGGLRKMPEKIVKFFDNGNGYMVKSFRVNGIIKNILAHRLVAITFIFNPENKLEVNHINGIKSDNRVSNLEWVTRSENLIHSVEFLGRKTHMEGKIRGKHPRAINIIQKSLNGDFVAKFSCLKDAEESTGVHRQSIGLAVRGINKTAGGYLWKKDNGETEI